MRVAGATAVIVLALLAGCGAPAQPAPATPDVGFEAFADCDGARAGSYAADCEDPRGSARYADPVAVHDAVPEGWTCAVGADHREDHPGTPAWWLWTRPAPLDQTQALLDRELLVGFEYDVSPREGPVEGVFQMFSVPGAPILRWTADGPHGFVEVATVRSDQEVEWDGVVAAPTRTAGPIDYTPTADWEAVYEPYSRFNATGLAVDSVEQAWGRHSRMPQDDWYPALFPTVVVRAGGEVRYLPAFEFPIVGGPDPKTQQGSGHWGSIFHGVDWTDVSDGDAEIRVHQAIHLRFDGHYEGLGRTNGCVVCPLIDLSDPTKVLRCALP